MPDKTDERLRALEAWLQRLYKDAESEMRGKWDKYMSRMEDRAETLLSRIREAKTDKERTAAETAYKNFLKSKTAGDKHYRDMVKELAREYSRTNERALEIINGKRADFFADGYNLSADAINDVAIREDIGIRFDLVDADAVAYLAKQRNDMNFPTPKYLEVNKDVLWNIKNINAQVAQGIVQGEGIPKIAARIQNVTGVNAASAVRTARTMATNSANAGRVHSMKTAEEWGVKTRKRWLCTHDSRTRDSHLEIDGETIADDATFSNGCRWPGDPIGPPEEVWNCRCTLITVVDGFSSNLPKGKEDAVHVWIDGEEVRSQNKSRDIATNRFGEKIEFSEKLNSKKWDIAKETIIDLAEEYDTKLKTVRPGISSHGAGSVQISGTVMDLSSSELNVVFHEFAHSISIENQTKYGLYNETDFWSEIKRIQRAYKKAVKDDSSRWISSYEHSSKGADEFMAEAFTQAKMAEMGIDIPEKYGKDYTFSNQVLDAIDKYFKKHRRK